MLPAPPQGEETIATTTARLIRIQARLRWTLLTLSALLFAVSLTYFALLANNDDPVPGVVAEIIGATLLTAIAIGVSSWCAVHVLLGQARIRSDIEDLWSYITHRFDLRDGPTEPLRVVASVAAPIQPPPDNVLAFELGRQLGERTRRRP